MKGTYDDNTKFYLELFFSAETPDNYSRKKESAKIHYDSVDGLNLDDILTDSLSDFVDIDFDKVDKSMRDIYYMQLHGWRKIHEVGNEMNNKINDDFNFGEIIDNNNISECIATVQIDTRKPTNLKVEQAFALNIAENWPEFSQSEKRVALCFLERYVLPFEDVRKFAHTGKLDMSSFEETYGKGR